VTPSLYERRFPERPEPTLVGGRVIGVRDKDGKVVPLPACCPAPWRCERAECWSHVSTLRRG
jgi:hypothetical protein